MVHIRQTYYPNESVLTTNGDVGRVVYHNYYTHTVNVLIRKNDNTWIMKKYSEFDVLKQDKLIWGMEVPFKSKFVSRIQYYTY